jgi:hypothetical protein
MNWNSVKRKEIKMPHPQDPECEKVSSLQDHSNPEVSFLTSTNGSDTFDNYEVR